MVSACNFYNNLIMDYLNTHGSIKTKNYSVPTWYKK